MDKQPQKLKNRNVQFQLNQSQIFSHEDFDSQKQNHKQENNNSLPHINQNRRASMLAQSIPLEMQNPIKASPTEQSAQPGLMRKATRKEMWFDRKNQILNQDSYQQNQKYLENQEFLKGLKSRNCKANIKKYRNELDQINYYMNPYNVTMSLSNIQTKVHQFVKEQKNLQTKSNEPQMQYQKLREYLRLNKQRLYLIPKHQIFEPDGDSNGLDFQTFKQIRYQDKDVKKIIIQHEEESQKLFDSIKSHTLKQSPMRMHNVEPLILEQNEEKQITEEIHKKFRQLSLKRSRDKFNNSHQPNQSPGNNRYPSHIGSLNVSPSRLSPNRSISFQPSVRNINQINEKDKLQKSLLVSNLNSLTDIFHDCNKVRNDGKKLIKNFEDNHEEFMSHLTNCKDTIKEFQVMGHLMNKSIQIASSESEDDS
ncbi:UNKNOWN [Stylonychia lemnae]|uniref:Uncharacterized protein n=1 Tax=Stylonychia lemnae TaxID=5949 RepID=A0A078AC83_STYLE|nr:UNKNOWN [Stylonychia lemnae]|eukprot:CDW78398.1 UNKNOWN [Stylonychia lemnae]